MDISQRNKFVCISIIIILSVNLLGCSVKKNKENELDENSSIGYYKRVMIDVPDGEFATNIAKNEIGGINVVTINEKREPALWYMNEDENWEKKLDLETMFDINGEADCKAFVSPQSDLFVEYSCSDSKASKKYFVVDSFGNKKELSLQLRDLRDGAICEQVDEHHIHENMVNSIYDVKFVENKIYAVDFNNDIYEINRDNYDVSLVFDGTKIQDINTFYVYDRTLLMWENEGIYYEGLDSHDGEGQMNAKFADFFTEAKQVNSLIEMDIENDEIWTLSGDKIGKYNLLNNQYLTLKVVGCQVTESIESFTVDNNTIFSLVSKYGEEGTILYKYIDEEENLDSNKAIVSDKSITGKGEKKLKIWTLEESATFQVAVRKFTDKYPEIDVDIEIGMKDRESGITENDAIKNLNTKLISGDAPDVIYMDGLSFDDYVESGKLFDMTAFVENLKSTGDYYNNILDSFSTDEKTYIVPSSIVLIGKVGKSDCLNASENMSTFIDYIKTHNSNNKVIPEELINVYILDMYYRDIKDLILSGDIDKNNLNEFFEESKNILELAGDMESRLDPILLYFSPNYALGYDGSFEFVIGNRVEVASSNRSYDDMAKKIGGKVELPANDYEDRYIVRDCVAISDSSANKELAQKYLEVVFSEECQSEVNGTVGFQINKNALRNNNVMLYSMFNNEDNQDVSTNTDSKVENGLEELDGKIDDLDIKMDALNKPIYIDIVLDYMVFDEMTLFIHGDKSKEDAVNSLFEKIDIYMSE